MGALMAALVAALLIRAADPASATIAVLADRTGRPGTMILTAFAMLLATQTIAAVLGQLTPHLTPNASGLMMGAALTAAGFGAAFPGKAKPVPDTRTTPSAAIRLAMAMTSDRTQFVTFAVALAGFAVLAGVGGVIGGLAVLSAAAIVGARDWAMLPHLWLGRAIGGVLVIAGIWQGLAAIRLI